IIVVTATYGQGDAPTNANRFLQLIDTIKKPQPFQFSVVGLGSLAYPDYCKFAFDVDASFHKDANASQALKPFTVNDKSVGAFQQWLEAWHEVVGLENQHIDWNLPQPKTVTFKVISKTEVGEQVDHTVLITLKPNRKQPFQSGDLLAIYPKNNHVERLYSIGNINDSIQLSVRLHAQGAGSGYLNHVQIGNTMQARIMTNTSFHFPKKAKHVIFIANGTGIAPFLGMLDENSQHKDTYLYYGLRHKASWDLYQSVIENHISKKKLRKVNLAFSKCDQNIYVQR